MLEKRHLLLESNNSELVLVRARGNNKKSSISSCVYQCMMMTLVSSGFQVKVMTGKWLLFLLERTYECLSEHDDNDNKKATEVTALV